MLEDVGPASSEKEQCLKRTQVEVYTEDFGNEDAEVMEQNIDSSSRSFAAGVDAAC